MNTSPLPIACVLTLAIVPSFGAVASDWLTPIGPFTGEKTETFNQWTTNQAVASLPVFGGFATLEKIGDGSIKTEWASLFLGHQVWNLGGMMGGQLAPAQWVFSEPVSRFGGMFENNSGSHDATVRFYDADDNFLEEIVASIPFGVGWKWNGWEFDIPVSRIVVVGNGVSNGFLWYENMQIDIARPQPANPADLDGDGSVGVSDLLILLAAWGACGDCAPGECPADLDGDCAVGVSDLLVLLANWG